MKKPYIIINKLEINKFLKSKRLHIKNSKSILFSIYYQILILFIKFTDSLNL